MNFKILPLVLLLLTLNGFAQEKSSKSEIPQKITAHVNTLNKNVDELQSDSESAGRRSRDAVDRQFSRGERWWSDVCKKVEKAWHNLQKKYRNLRDDLYRQTADFRSVWHEVSSFFNSK